MFMSYDQTTVQNYNIKLANKSFENVAEFKYLGTTVTHLNYIYAEMKAKLNSWNDSYEAFQKLLSSRLLSKNVNIKQYLAI
jgi:hypothetical protein